MCGGGGGGGLDQSTIDLQNYQLAQSKKEEQRLKDEEARQQQAKNAIRVLYGYEPQAYDNMVTQDQKNAIYAYYDNANKKPRFYEKPSYQGSPISWNGRGEAIQWEAITNPNYAANKASYEQALTHWTSNRDKYYQTELSKLLNGVDLSAQSAEAKNNATARQAGYDQIRASNMAILQDDINRNRNDAARLLKFGLSRSGLSGGSVDIDENRNLTDANQRSIIQANQLSDNQVQQVRAKDESDYATAIQKIDAGLDADTAITTATQAVKNNRDQAISDPTSSSLNNLFASIGNAWSNYQYGQAAANPYGRSTAISSTGGSKGRLS